MIVTHAADHDGAVPGEASIEDAAGVLVCCQEGVHFVDQQGRRPQFDGAEQRGGPDVGHLQGTVGQLAQGGQEDGLTATLLRGSDVGDGCHLHHINQPGEGHPQGGGAQRFLVGNHVTRQSVGDVVQQIGTVHRTGPELHLGEDADAGSAVIVAAGRDPIEFHHAQLLGFLHLDAQPGKGCRVLAAHGLELVEDLRLVQGASIAGQAADRLLDGALRLKGKGVTHGQPSSWPDR
ncbi:hypothetical protein FQZ97_778110 [compost metagenome]